MRKRKVATQTTILMGGNGPPIGIAINARTAMADGMYPLKLLKSTSCVKPGVLICFSQS
jgi:hypothetical protein